MADQAMKKDAGKDRWDLLPLDCIEGMVKVLTFGANKYADNGWKKLMADDPGAVARVTASLRRHQLAIEKHGLTALDLNKKGKIDKDHSGLPHISHVMCNVMFLEYKRQLMEKE
jgi:hypothetical protein